ncbi:Myosin-14 [Glycine soja]
MNMHVDPTWSKQVWVNMLLRFHREHHNLLFSATQEVDVVDNVGEEIGRGGDEAQFFDVGGTVEEEVLFPDATKAMVVLLRLRNNSRSNLTEECVNGTNLRYRKLSMMFMKRRKLHFSYWSVSLGFNFALPFAIRSCVTDAMSLRHGSKVWLEDRDSAWLAAEVLDSDGNRLLLVTDSGKKVYASPEKLLPRDADEEEHGGFEDMTRLAYLNEPGVLFNLRRRYALNDIYTYTGSILIAVNPFTKLPHLYDSHMMEQYKGAPLGELSPHVFAVADASYRAMMNEGKSQSILVSGESGAGKTETTKLIMQYLTFVGGRAAGDERTVEQQVLESNPLLEAFGNARTVRNDNSRAYSPSWFSSILVGSPVVLAGICEGVLGSPTLPASAQLIYLLGNFTLCQLVLSTSRSASGKGMRWCGGVGVERVGVFVCTTSVLEDSYRDCECCNSVIGCDFGCEQRHDCCNSAFNLNRFGKFVEIQFDSNGSISGAAIRTYLLERSRVVQLTDPERNYHCFYQLCACERDAEKYKLGHPSHFHYLNQSKVYELDGVSNAEEYLKTRRAMDIVGISYEDQEAIFRVLAAILHLGNIEFSPGKEHDSSVIKDEKSRFHMQMAADLFICDVDLLLATLCTRSIQTREGSIVKALDCNAAIAGRDALAKTVYARLFDWLVAKINRSVGQDINSKIQIGVLDIYGFECFKDNSFEQFCINFANEKLQQHFNEHVFKMEQEEYGKEEINWSYIEFVDNQDVLDLIEKKPIGIIALLDEACMFPKSTHETFSTKLFQHFRSHPRLGKEKFSQTDFTISHYAGKVTYHTDTFLDKNRDYVVVEHCNLLSSSKCPFVSGLFPLLPEESSRSSYKFSSVAARFKQQLQALMETLNSTEPHYIRCVKPNSLNRPQIFENASVIHQLRCGGVLEAVRISLAGYPTRRTYSEFVDRFGLIAPEFMDGSPPPTKSSTPAPSSDAPHPAATPCTQNAASSDDPTAAMSTGTKGGDEHRHERRQQAPARTAATTRTKAVNIAAFAKWPHFSLISSQTSPCLSSFRSTSSQTSLLPLSSLVTVAIYSTDCAWLLCYDDKAATEKILQKLKLENFQLGRTKVFLRAGQIGILDSRRAEVLDNAAKYIQRRLRTFIAHRDFILARAAAFSLQACCRGYIARKIYAAKRETAAAISIQKYIRMWLVRHAYFKLYFSAIIIQSHVRGFVTRQRLLHGKEHRAATFIQAYWRMSKVRSSFRRHQASIVAIQCLWRCRQAKRELRRLKQEANEAGALRLAKNKLEKQLEELTWRLHLEKKMRVSNEEAKKIEIFKLQKMLEALNLELDAAKLAKINECNKNAVLQNQFELSVKEKSALKRELVAVDELRKENALLKVSLGAFEKKCTTLELELMNAQKGRDETMEKLRESEQKCSQLEQNVKRLEEKLLSLEDENHVLRQKALSTPLLKSNRPSFAKSISEKYSSAIASRTERKTIFESPTPTKLIAPFTLGLSDSRRSKLTAERQQDNYEFLSKCIKENLGFKNGKPIAARIIYKCLLHWHSFESERTTIFDSIIEGINEVLKVREDDIILPYWLSNTSALLCLLQRNLRSNGFLTTTAQRYPGSSGLTSRAGHGPKSPLKFIGYDDGVLHVEARYPAILFKQQLTACVEKIFGLLRDNLKKELSPLLGSCIQAPKTGRGLHGGKSSRSPGGIPQQSSSGQWSNIVKFLDSLMGKLRQNHVLLERGITKTRAVPGGPFCLSPVFSDCFHILVDFSACCPSFQQYFAFCGAFSAVCRQSSGDPSPASPSTNLHNGGDSHLIRASTLSHMPFCHVPNSFVSNQTVEFTKISLHIHILKFGGQHSGYHTVETMYIIGVNFLGFAPNLITHVKCLVPSFFIRKLVTQVFSFINITLFNSLLLRRECCTFSNGEYVKSGVAELEKWIVNATEEYAGTSWHELNYIRQAIGFLVIHQKRKKSLEEIRQDLCPVVSEMREIVSKDNQNLTSNSFLLDDDLSIPFSAEDIDMAIPAIDVDEIDLPEFMSEYSCAQFLSSHQKSTIS